MKWTVTFYSRSVEKDIHKLSPAVRADMFNLMEEVQQRGPNLGMPHSKAMGDGLFELRATAFDGKARALFGVIINREIVILSCFSKKTQRTPKKELELARKRLKKLTNEVSKK